MILLGVVVTLAAICVLVFGPRHALDEGRAGSDVDARSRGVERGSVPRVEAQQRGEVER